MKRAIFIGGGLGDALLTLPLARYLKSLDGELIALLSTPMMPLSFLASTEIFDRIEHLTHPFMPESGGWKFTVRKVLSRDIVRPSRDRWSFWSCLLRNYGALDEVYVPPFALSNMNVALAPYIGRKLISLSPELQDHFPLDKHQLVQGVPGQHMAIQNRRMANANPCSLSQELISLPSSCMAYLRKIPPMIQEPYVAVQLSGVDDFAPEKSWPIAQWEQFLRWITEQFPRLHIILVGSQQQAAARYILEKNIPRVASAVGDTSLEKVSALLLHATCFVGLDSGLMHLAAALNRPTFTLWGASNPQLFGYEQMDPIRHRVISQNLSCGPCQSWLQPNRTRVQIPSCCPDFVCLRGLLAEDVISAFLEFFPKVI